MSQENENKKKVEEKMHRSLKDLSRSSTIKILDHVRNKLSVATHEENLKTCGKWLYK